jgi:hypothetical protein
MGCPTYTAPYDPQEAANYVYDNLYQKGYVCDVTIKDFDGTGVMDYGVVFKDLVTNEKRTVFDLIVAGTIIVGTANSQLTWQSDKLLVTVEKDTWMATTAGCQAVVECLSRDCSQDELDKTFAAAWGIEEGQEGETGPL